MNGFPKKFILMHLSVQRSSDYILKLDLWICFDGIPSIRNNQSSLIEDIFVNCEVPCSSAAKSKQNKHLPRSFWIVIAFAQQSWHWTSLAFNSSRVSGHRFLFIEHKPIWTKPHTEHFELCVQNREVNTQRFLVKLAKWMNE